MKRLFMLRHGKGRSVVRSKEGQPMYYGDKPSAKQARQEGQVVSYGVDHRKYKGD